MQLSYIKTMTEKYNELGIFQRDLVGFSCFLLSLLIGRSIVAGNALAVSMSSW